MHLASTRPFPSSALTPPYLGLLLLSPFKDLLLQAVTSYSDILEGNTLQARKLASGGCQSYFLFGADHRCCQATALNVSDRNVVYSAPETKLTHTARASALPNLTNEAGGRAQDILLRVSSAPSGARVVPASKKARGCGQRIRKPRSEGLSKPKAGREQGTKIDGEGEPIAKAPRKPPTAASGKKSNVVESEDPPDASIRGRSGAAPAVGPPQAPQLQVKKWFGHPPGASFLARRELPTAKSK